MRKEYLLRGDSLKFDGGFEIYQPTVESVMEIGYSSYMWFVECLCSNVADMIVPLWGRGIDFEEIEESDLFTILVKGNEDSFETILKYFSNADSLKLVIAYGEIYIDVTVGGKLWKIDDTGILHIKDFFSSINKIQHAKMRKFAGQKTKKSFLDEDYEEMLDKSKEQSNSDTFGNVLSDLVVINGRDWNHVYGLTMAQLYEELTKSYRNKKINLTLQGIYAGNIDGNKIPSSDLELNI